MVRPTWHSVAADEVEEAGSAVAAEGEHEAEEVDSVEAVVERGPVEVFRAAAEVGTLWEARRRLVVRVVVARRHVPQLRLLDPIPEQVPVHGQVAAAEVPEQEIARQLNRRIVRVPVQVPVLERDRVPPHCLRIDLVPELGRELALAKVSRIDREAGPGLL